MLSSTIRALRKKFITTAPRDSVVELYDDRLWPWLRRFLRLWACLAIYCGLTILLDAYGVSPVTHRYAYGLIRF